MELSLLVRYLLWASVGLFAMPPLISLSVWVYNGFVSWEKRKKSAFLATMMLLAFLVASIGTLRYALGRFELHYPSGESVAQLSWWQELFQSLFRSLRTFGIAEDYGKLIVEIRRMFATLFPERAWLSVFFEWYATVQCLLAPIVGGALVLEVLASVFPRLRLWWACLNVQRKKYYFSKLNAASLALAKSLCSEKTARWERPVVVFTDAYVDDKQESGMELLSEAKRCGAICLRDDLAHVQKNRRGSRSYFLIDESELVNLQALVDLAEERNFNRIKRAKIYLFVQSEAYVEIEKKVRAKMKAYRKKTEDFPLIVPVNSLRNLVNNLFNEVPLYEPLIRKENPATLNVTILGSGVIGTEALLSTYWLGQLLVNKGGVPQECRVTVNVVSKDEEAAFYAKLDYINPEIRKTTGAARDILLWDPIEGQGIPRTRDMQNAPYCSIRYRQADLKNGELWDSETEKKAHLLDSDYFIVALGTDADNIATAEKLRRHVGQQQLEGKRKADAVIAYAVLDTQLCDVLNTRDRQTPVDTAWGIYMYAFGNLKQVYSRENVMMSRWSVWANETEKACERGGGKSHYVRENEERAKDEDRNYNHWANLARAMHVKYKVFSLGWIHTSLFDPPQGDEEAYRDVVRELCAQYKRIAVIDNGDLLNPADKEKWQSIEMRKEGLAWLEHRRWCAFTRTMGYQRTTALAENLYRNGNHKHMPLKLHPCLVEARRPRYGSAERFWTEGACIDRLDMVTQTWKETVAEAAESEDEVLREKALKAKVYNFKKFDYHRHEFGQYVWVADLAAKKIPGLTLTRVTRLCEKKKIEGAFAYTVQGRKDWSVSEELLKDWVHKAFVTVGEETDIALCQTGAVEGAFKFGGTWFATRRALRIARRFAEESAFDKE